MTLNKANDVVRSRGTQLFRYLQALNELRNPVTRDLSDQAWVLHLNSLPEHATVTRGRAATATEPGDDFLLRVARPTLSAPPRLPESLNGWLKSPPDNPHVAPTFKSERNVVDANGSEVDTKFDADLSRVAEASRWLKSWEAWAEIEIPAREALKVFEKLYELHGHLQRESERFELVAGDGLLSWRRQEGLIRHPVLLQRVALEFDAAAAVFTISQTEHPPELYTALLRHIPEVPGRILSELRSELDAAAFEPFAPESAPFFRGIATRLASSGQFLQGPDTEPATASPRISRDPVFFLRQRAQGLASILDGVLGHLQNGGNLPAPLQRIVGFAARPPDGGGFTTPGRDRHEILFTKPANEEQFAIADQLARHGSVLVQGPPGTGKTHTIANVIGDLLAQGQRVLVTSHTTKALSVLREKVVAPLQPLCVSVLDSDLASRAQLEASIAEIVRRLGDNAESLESQAAKLGAQRADLLRTIDDCEARIIDIREGEYRDIVVGEEHFSPASAARIVADCAQADSWIPGPVAAGAPIPISEAEIHELYRTNVLVSKADEQSLDAALPDINTLVHPDHFEEAITERKRLNESGDVRKDADFWDIEWTDQTVPCICRKHNRVASTALLHDLRCGHCKAPLFPAFADYLDPHPVGFWPGLLARVQEALRFLNTAEPWHVSAIAAGAGTEAERRPWETLVSEIQALSRRAALSLELQIQHGPKLLTDHDLEAQRSIATELIEHVESGGTLGALTLALRPQWRRWLASTRVDSGTPRTVEHLRALLAEIELRQARRQLAMRWERFAVPAGAPVVGDVNFIERELAPQVQVLNRCLAWYAQVWQPLESELQTARLRWSKVLTSIALDGQPHAEVRRWNLALGKLEDLLASHRARQRWMQATHILSTLATTLSSTSSQAPTVSELREAIVHSNPVAYREAFSRLESIRRKFAVASRRRALLTPLRDAAPAWADLIDNRVSPHDQVSPPGSPKAAWLWRQLHDELERRGKARMDEVETRLLECKDRLAQVTAAIVERRAWAAQIRRIEHSQRMALVGWADTVRRIGRGTGKRAPQLLAKARELMQQCRGAVPVWIMPLSRVAESFPASTRFDVVIVDEASQSDVMALVALYMGDTTIIVGDNEQVSPEAVGQDLTEVQRLIDEHLVGIPNGHLYDGKTSIYDLARQSFGGAIRLREHFRCLPEIIQFSNDLAYDGDIQPLRDDAGAKVRPATVVVRVDGAVSRNKRNRREVEVVTSLIVAALDEPEYSDASVGVISMVGDEQAYDIATELGRRLPPATLERHRVMCGNPAQFQGDERDVMFLSMVDAPEGAVLPLRGDDRFKKRFNVAASRARDQMWVVHSLNHETDLKVGDLRRSLIEHAMHPESRVVEWRRLRARVDRRSGEFEQRVLKCLLQRNYAVTPQYPVGAYVLDFVVHGNGERVALECDGDRYHTLDNLQEDMARQAVLERRGWRFVRIRSTDFFRCPTETMNAVFEKLDRLGIRPSQATDDVKVSPRASALVERIKARAEQLRRHWYETASVLDDEGRRVSM